MSIDSMHAAHPLEQVVTPDFQAVAFFEYLKGSRAIESDGARYVLKVVQFFSCPLFLKLNRTFVLWAIGSLCRFSIMRKQQGCHRGWRPSQSVELFLVFLRNLFVWGKAGFWEKFVR